MKFGLFKVDDGLKCNCIKIFATGEGTFLPTYFLYILQTYSFYGVYFYQKDLYDIDQILLKVALNTVNQPLSKKLKWGNRKSKKDSFTACI
jgi:hypothetical protein